MSTLTINHSPAALSVALIVKALGGDMPFNKIAFHFQEVFGVMGEDKIRAALHEANSKCLVNKRFTSVFGGKKHAIYSVSNLPRTWFADRAKHMMSIQVAYLGELPCSAIKEVMDVQKSIAAGAMIPQEAIEVVLSETSEAMDIITLTHAVNQIVKRSVPYTSFEIAATAGEMSRARIVTRYNARSVHGTLMLVKIAKKSVEEK